ncbi:HNH endonuclease [Agrococcus terreus]|uniref:HNH endonuclease signature motif containing protein n=1 Tax=Agrococcus terreus TaxID=574649 RepID=UPI00384F3698
MSTQTPSAAPAEPVSPHAVAAHAMEAVVGIDEAIASLQAMRAHLMAGLARMAVDDALETRTDQRLALREVAAELATRQRRSDRTLEAELGGAMVDVAHWPATVRAWGDARIHRGHVPVIAEVGLPLQDPAARASFEAALLPHAERMAPGRLRRLARRELEHHLAEPLVDRHRTAREQRGVSVTDVDDGMSILRATIPTLLAHGIADRLTRMARTAPAEDPRTIDQRRADAFCDLLLTGDATGSGIDGIRAEVSVVIPATALVTASPDADHSPDGVAPRLLGGSLVDAETVRDLAAAAPGWSRLFTDPLRGHVVATDSYQPTAGMRRLLRHRDQTCRFPGCGASAHRTDVDHTIGWADGGSTSLGNLAHLCRRHHTLKGTTRWRLEQPEPGTLRWTSPTGRTYIDEPAPIGPRFTEREHQRSRGRTRTRTGDPEPWHGPPPRADAPPLPF